MTSTTAADWLEVTATIVPPSADAGASAGAIEVGAPFVLAIEAKHAPGGIALLPQELSLPDALGERTQSRRHVRRTVGNQEVDRYELELIAFEAGDQPIPPISLALGSTTAATPELTVTVKSGFDENEALVASSTRPEAIGELESMAAANPTPEKIHAPDYTLFWVLGVVALLALVVVILRKLSDRERPVPIVPPPPPRPAHEIALERLDGIDRLIEDDLKPFFVELSEILREYAGGRYGFDSLELTIDELMAALDRRETPGLDSLRLQDVLVRADLVKFAKYRADAEEAQADLATARAIVETTKAAPAADRGLR